MDGATDVQGGRISAGSPGGDGGWDEHPGGLPGVRPAPGHGAHNAGLLSPAGFETGCLHRYSTTDSPLIAAGYHAHYHSTPLLYQFQTYLSVVMAASLHIVFLAHALFGLCPFV